MFCAAPLSVLAVTAPSSDMDGAGEPQTLGSVVAGLRRFQRRAENIECLISR
jgi:hypothetical protein